MLAKKFTPLFVKAGITQCTIPTIRTIHQISRKSNVLGLSRTFSPYTPQNHNPNQIIRRTYIIPPEFFMIMTAGLIGVGAVGGGIVTIIGKYIYGRSKNNHEKLKEYEQLIKEKQMKDNEKNKKEQTDFEQFKKNYDEFQKYMQEKKNRDKDI